MQRPILFSGPMVRALLAKTKTQTRRIVKCKHLDFVAGCEADRNDPCNYGYECDDGWVKLKASTDPRDDEIQAPCPYGQKGDRLWVRETWMENSAVDFGNGHGAPLYRASWGNVPEGARWRPSIYMPHWASRITLEITSVRAERLQAISEADAYAEGVDGGCRNCGNASSNDGCGCPDPCPLPRDSFCNLWETINGPGSWAFNPFVWVIEFRQVTAP